MVAWNSRASFSHISGGQKSEIKMLPGQHSLRGLKSKFLSYFFCLLGTSSRTSLAHGHNTPISDPCSTSLLFCVSPPKFPLPLILQEYMRFRFSLTWMSQSKLYSPFLKLKYVFFHIRQYSPFAIENSSHRFQGFGCGLMEGRASFSPLYQPK